MPSQSYGRCMHLLWEAISLMNACWVSQSMFYQVLNAVMSVSVMVMVCLKKMFNGEIIFHLKRRLKRLCYYKWRLDTIIVKFRNINFFEHPFEGPKILGTKYCVAVSEKGIKNWKFIFLWRKINWQVLQIAKAQLRDLVHDFWKKYY